jgi:hypothetical protein
MEYICASHALGININQVIFRNIEDERRVLFSSDSTCDNKTVCMRISGNASGNPVTHALVEAEVAGANVELVISQIEAP